eukprot:TRINITY_DN4989_c0_g1_i1.p1 TRINITY_DN4989_c0_g1~~TRINITY_DN4989_c0_g1_i1.p1  ORF type:complete len:523 (+),score=109.32 TRINITY_DN4989_c0_g1_i1:57-1625(+)
MAPASLGFIDDYFEITERGSTLFTEFRAGITLFITSVYILALNPLILSGGGMNKEDVLLATAISTGVGTAIMGFAGNYPWVVSVQLGTNVYFVYNLIRPSSTVANCAKLGLPVPAPVDGATESAGCFDVEISYKKALAATFLEGVAFLIIALGGFRSQLMAIFPKVVLMSGASGIGLFIAFVGLRQMGVVVANSPPNLIQFNHQRFMYCTNNYKGDGEIDCPWLSLAGLVVTGILTVYMVNGSLLMGIFFTTFIAWAKFPSTAPTFSHIPKFHDSAFSLDFAWGNDAGTLVEGVITFLYLDFIGSSITFYSMGKMMDVIDPETNAIPHTNKAFLADAVGSMMGGLLGTSCLTTYVESASAVKEGGRTGITAIVCSVCFFAMCLLSPIFAGPIPNIATGPILVTIGLLIFNDSIVEIAWNDLTEAAPAFMTIIVQPFTNNIAYGAIAGFGSYIILKTITYKFHPIQQNWPGYRACTDWLEKKAGRSMKMGGKSQSQVGLMKRMNSEGGGSRENSVKEVENVAV